MRQEYSSEALQQISDQYGLGKIKTYFLFTSGFENTNYFLETEKGKFVAKIFEGLGMQQENILFELKIISTCSKAAIKVPHIVENSKGQFLTAWNNKFVAIMEYIDAENMDEKQIPDSLAYEVGCETGKMDSLLAEFKDGSKTRQNYEWDLKNFLSLETKIKYLEPEYDREPIQTVFDEFKTIKPEFDSLPSGIIHNDVALHNILVKEGQLMAVIDFSDMAFSPYVQNLTVPMAQMLFCYNWQPQQAKLFVQGYNELHRLSQKELGLLYSLTRARYATLVVEFNYWEKVLRVSNHQLKKTVNDFYNFLIKFTEFGKDRFDKLILS